MREDESEKGGGKEGRVGGWVDGWKRVRVRKEEGGGGIGEGNSHKGKEKKREGVQDSL